MFCFSHYDGVLALSLPGPVFDSSNTDTATRLATITFLDAEVNFTFAIQL